jgi:hypothetical protein
MKNLNQEFLFMDPVVHKNWAMEEFTHSRPFADDAAHTWEATEQIDVIQQSVAKTDGESSSS